MRFKKLLLPSVACLLLMFSGQGIAQGSYVKQVITANSGKFEYAPPFTDYVTLESYNPQTTQIYTFGTVYTQSAQNVLISGHFAFFTAQDSIVKYDLNTFQRISAIADSGLNLMAIYKGRLLVSKQYPVTQGFLEVLDTSNLFLLTTVTGISGDCGGITTSADTVYVAVNGGWMGTEGKLAIIDPASWTLKTEVNFGHKAIGIFNLYRYNDKIISVNKTPYGVVDTGSITVYTPSTRGFNNVFLPKSVTAGSGIKDSLLYLGMNYGIGSVNLNSLKIADTVIVKDPGSSVFTYIISSALDTLNGLIYANTGDYTHAGTCIVTSIKGDSITEYPTGISSDGIAIDTRKYGAGIEGDQAGGISARLYPNPVHERLNIIVSENIHISAMKVIDVSGREMMEVRPGMSSTGKYEINVRALEAGVYYLLLMTADGRIVKQFAVSAL
ncbi:MAG: T9SS type A sorting domain-containing protein [Bacteroidota bacterium]